MEKLFGDKLKHLRNVKDLSLEQLSKLTGIPAQTLNRYELNQRVPKITIIPKIATALNVTPMYFMDTINEAVTKKSIKIPVLGRVQAGIPVEAVEDIIDYEEITQEMAAQGDFFGLQIKGDSMMPRICENDVVIVRKQEDVENGDIAVILINGSDATCKKFYKYDNGINLVSLNPSYPPMFFSCDEVQLLPVNIIGKVVELRGKF